MNRADLAVLALRLSRRLLAIEEPILTRHDMPMWSYAVLTALREGPTRTQAALAAAIGADKTRLIPNLDDLQKRGLIDREPDPADRRVRLLALTPAGRQTQQAIQSEIHAGEEELLSALPPDDREAFVRALMALSQR
ncbi:MarR family winged helix-turn-helix transcriptional regulator [Actinoplanes derwentensis]|uniref:DNA-binding transcriptional regulator, MarR family n=1 Tax=Actinoplanes derwentensis TaxID=113562 RepID=A0A1H1TR93_9ACTN|nr:MarR family winged helix-turn-helix transcriptional regulator [Actinoplanes derwentensis]GID85110.1 putative transcriptional regulator, MarR family protein [Actinoplanes derwentensis]SDS62722.1 DNA-binding transcriptional regulator, MarR family [Actinoplanes derwentensis]